MRVVAVVMAVLFLVAPASSGFAWPRSVGKSHNCTVWAVRVDLLVTASHCVGIEGEGLEVAQPLGAGWRWHHAEVVWDGTSRDDEYWRPDVALLKPSLPWAEFIPIARMAPEYEPCVTLSHPGVERMRGVCIAYGIRLVDGEWMLTFYGTLVGPGSSGGPVLVNGAVVGIISAGNFETKIYRATPAGDVARAIREYDRSR